MCSFDLYTLLDPEGVEIEVMHTPTLNEADEYGSAFSRGMKVVLPEKTVLYISGTASVDEKGDTVHLDDVQKQVERMLVNVRELLRPHNSTFADVVQVITYLKYADYLADVRRHLEEVGIVAVCPTRLWKPASAVRICCANWRRSPSSPRYEAAGRKPWSDVPSSNEARSPASCDE